ELAYFGAKVIHPQCLGPVMAAQIPLRIRNTMQPELPGTLIGADSVDQTSIAQPVRGVSSSDGLALLTVEGTGMIGVPGTAQRVFAALHSAGVSVVMISQGSSEHSICSVVREEQVALGQQALQRAFQMELAAGAIQRIQIEPGISVLAAVGDGMTGMPGIAARLFQSLAQARINVRAIAQGSSERSISVALGSGDSHKALRAIHAGFWLSPQTLSVAMIGPGNVGAELLQQLQDTLPELMQRRGLDIRIRAIANSRRMLLADPVVDLEQWQAQFDSHAQPLDLEQLREHLQVAHLPHAVIVDCSASDALADHYSNWLQAGIHIVTPNKHAGSGDWERYQQIQSQARRQGVSYHYETTVGAGLPVIQTLR
ncbi:MAG TPA: ACT domain-containing protein, partial [Chromatiales bacterium]|nr:ACT domain-containing protein [Chromatiales bacterium]